MKTKNSAVTLIELIIATLIVSMVVAGVFSAEYALRRTNENGSGDAQTSVLTKSLAESVRSSVKSLHGDTMTPDTGITINFGGKSMCFRHDVQVAGQYTPANYADDNWTCYTQIGTNVYRCELAASGVCANTDVLVGSLVTDQFTNAVILALGPTTSISSGVCSFSMTFVGRRDPTAGAAVAAGKLTSGTDANPQILVRVFENAGF